MNVTKKERISEILFWSVNILIYPSMLFVLVDPFHKAYVLFVCFISIFIIVNNKVSNYKFFLISLLSLLYLIAYPFLNSEVGDGDSLTIIFRWVSILVLLLLISTTDLERQAKIFVNIILLIVILNGISTILVLFFNLDGIPFSDHNGRELSYYIGTLSAVRIPFSNYLIIKGAGIFDEPGALAYFSFMAVIINHMGSSFSKRKEFLLIFFGLLTFSLAFLILIVIYVITVKLRSIIRLKFIVPLLILTGVFFSSLTLDSEITDNIYKLTIGRLLSDDTNDEGRSITNTRAHINNISLYFFSENPILGYGVNHALSSSNDYGSASIIATLGGRGIVGTFLILLPLLYAVVIPFLIMIEKRVNIFVFYELSVLIFLVLICFSQRPFISMPLNFFSIYFFYVTTKSYLSKRTS